MATRKTLTVAAAALLAALTILLWAAGPSGAAPARASAPKPDVATCALGRLTTPLDSYIPAAIARAEAKYVGGVPRADRVRAGRAFATGAAAYLWGMPPVLERLTVNRWPANTLLAIGQLMDPEQKSIVAPNHDTLYSIAHIDLSSGPLVVDAPATEGRYSVLQLLDGYTNAAGYIGSGSSRDSAQSVAIVGPGYTGAVPGGLTVVHSPTNLMWLLGRTLVDGPEDFDAAVGLMKQYHLTPLAAWQGGTRSGPVLVSQVPPQAKPVIPEGNGFFDLLGDDLALDPAPARDACALAAFAKFGIGPGLHPSAGADPVVSAALAASVAPAARIVDNAVDRSTKWSEERHRGWSFTRNDTARFGKNYAYRAVIGRAGLGANVSEEAIYPWTDSDSKGRTLSGRHDYVIRFAAGELPPVRSFWSLTMYDTEKYLVANPIDRYNLGDRSAGLKYGKGRSLTIYVSNHRPKASRVANWLPSPKGRFSLYLRLYEPKKPALTGRWDPPTITRVR